MTQAFRLLTRAHYRVMPWRNGTGTTTEILVHDPAAPSGSAVGDSFLWRVSLADVAASGPFSTFHGVDRVIVQTEGASMRLTHGEHGAQTLTLNTPYRFSGDWETAAELAGPAKDFNVMVRRGRAAAHVETLQLESGRSVARTLKRGWILAHVLRGAVAVTGYKSVAQAGDTVVLEGESPTLALASAEPAGIILVMVLLQNQAPAAVDVSPSRE